MNKLQIFKSSEFGQVRTVTIDGEPWLVGKDIATAFGYTNTRKALNDHVDDEDKGVTKCDTLGGAQEMTIINESGLYSLVLSSKLPTAKKFKHWVTSEVLPAIRKHGGYLTPEKIEEALLNPDTIIRLATELKEERAARKELGEQVAMLTPKGIFADAVDASSTSILVGELAKLLKQNGVDMGRNRLFEWLKQNGYLIKSGSERNMPAQRSMEMKLFEIKERSVNNPDGSIKIVKTSKVTGKGQIYFVNLFLKIKNKKEGN